MPFDMAMFNDFLQRKYAIMQQQADTARLGALADANLANTRAGLLPAESRANIGLTNAQATEAVARGKNIDETTQYVGPLARSSIALNTAQGREAGARASNIGEDTTRLQQLNRFGLSIGDVFRFQNGF